MKEQKTYTLEELAQYTNSSLVGNPRHLVFNVADLESASPCDVSFLSNPRYENAMVKSKAGAIFVTGSTSVIADRNFLVNENPSQAFQKILELFHGRNCAFTGFAKIHPSAVIHASCQLGHNVQIGPYAVIDENVIIGDDTFIGSGCYVGPSVTIGKECVLHPRVTIRETCTLGDKVILQPGVVIGACGFGYITDKQGKHTKLNQVGTVVLEDEVEIGANATIDRARFKETRIKKGTKIDNLVQIGHGVVIGEDNIIVAQTGIAGSTKTGRGVVIGGQVAVAGHIEIGDGVIE